MFSGSPLLTVAIGIMSGFLVILACPSDKDKKWSFDDNLPNGPQHWCEINSECCISTNKMQSPIDINTTNAHDFPDAGGLDITNYDKPLTKAKFNNSGYTVEITPSDGIERSVSINSTSYPLVKITIRVGNRTKGAGGKDHATPGSDHRVDGKQYDVELQFYHEDKNRKIVVISAFFDESSSPKGAFGAIYTDEVLKNVQYKGDSYEANITSPLASLDSFVPPGSPYYAYKGSFTVPPCKSGVDYLIKKGKLSINRDVLSAIQGLHSVAKEDLHGDKCLMRDNVRPAQPMGDRTIYSVE